MKVITEGGRNVYGGMRLNSEKNRKKVTGMETCLTREMPVLNVE